ncbi:MAG: hypothetical protein HOV94_22905, partial [Saccharothrix sp.]|nr:hypothetical protein [Saccharothrix sp.]
RAALKPAPPPARRSPQGRRRVRATRRYLVAAAALAVAVPLVLWGVDRWQAADGTTGNPTTTSTSTTGTSTESAAQAPGPIAQTRQLRDFVSGWDAYNAWVSCARASREETLDGNYPAAATRQEESLTETNALYCRNDGTFTARFTEYIPEVGYNTAIARYRAAPAPVLPVGLERTPPEGVHVFQWSPDERALVWSDDRAHMIGVLTTTSPNADLVDVWTRYHR